MYRICFLLLLACNAVLCEDCVTDNFENGFESNNFTNTVGWCVGWPMWNIGQYSSVNMNSPYPGSTSFITPLSGWTCMISFKFTITGGGTLEVYRYANSSMSTDSAYAEVYQDGAGGRDVTIGKWYLWSKNMVPGWKTLRFRIPGSNTFNGRIAFWGRYTSVLIDSFRYIAPSFDEDLCVTYKEEQTTTTTKAPTTSTTTTTAELSTSKITTTELPTTNTTSPEAPSTKTTATVESATTKTTLKELCTSTPVPSTTTARTTTVKPTTTTAATTPTTATETTPSTSTKTPRLFISVQTIYKEVNAKIMKYFR